MFIEVIKNPKYGRNWFEIGKKLAFAGLCVAMLGLGIMLNQND